LSSNQKPPGKTESPQEPFKRAVSGCMRALARMPQLEVAYAAEKPSLVRSGITAKARLPEPVRTGVFDEVIANLRALKWMTAVA